MFGPPYELIECQSLYNVLNESEGVHAKIRDPFYLYLIDCRARADYNESHILAAKNIKRTDKSFKLPYEAELESRNIVVVYDSKTDDETDKNADAVKCAKFLGSHGSKNSVKILKGGYEAFSRLYPFLRRQQIIYMPRELDELRTYPSEIIPGLLYLGNQRHGSEEYIKKDLKLTSFVECSTEASERFKGQNGIDYLNLVIEDSPEAVFTPAQLETACNFIDVNVKNRQRSCLVFSNLGISRAATIVVAYIVYMEKIGVEEACKRVSKYKKVQPQPGFLEQIKKSLVIGT